MTQPGIEPKAPINIHIFLKNNSQDFQKFNETTVIYRDNKIIQSALWQKLWFIKCVQKFTAFNKTNKLKTDYKSGKNLMGEGVYS